MEKTVSIHAVHTVSIKRVIHLTEPVWRHAKMNLMRINVKQVLLTPNISYLDYIDLWFTVTRWKTKTKNMLAICTRLFGVILELTSIRLFKTSTPAFPIPVLLKLTNHWQYKLQCSQCSFKKLLITYRGEYRYKNQCSQTMDIYKTTFI